MQSKRRIKVDIDGLDVFHLIAVRGSNIVGLTELAVTKINSTRTRQSPLWEPSSASANLLWALLSSVRLHLAYQWKGSKKMADRNPKRWWGWRQQSTLPATPLRKQDTYEGPEWHQGGCCKKPAPEAWWPHCWWVMCVYTIVTYIP